MTGPNGVGKTNLLEALHVGSQGFSPRTRAEPRLVRFGEAAARVIRRPPLLGSGQLHFLLWQARADNSTAQSALGVEFTPWKEGIRRTVRWMAEAGRI